MGAGVVGALLSSMSYAGRSRMLTSARAVVQRNVDAATGVLYSGSTSIPLILTTTNGANVTCDDDGGSSTETLTTLRGGTRALVTGTLSRNVHREAILSGSLSDVSGIVVMRVTFQVDYDYLGRHYTYGQSTLRSQDTQ